MSLQTPAIPPTLLDIELPLSLRLGRSRMLLGDAMALRPGSLIALDRAPEEPVEVFINGRMVARGEVVMVRGNYGLRLTQVCAGAAGIESAPQGDA